MKPFILSACLCLILFGCKKDSSEHTINIHITNISQTTFNFSIVNHGGGSPDYSNANTNGDYTTAAQSGKTLDVTWAFITQGHQYGQGNIAIIEGADTLLKINGGYGSNSITVR